MSLSNTYRTRTSAARQKSAAKQSSASNRSPAVKRIAAAIFAAAIVSPLLTSAATAADYRYWTFWTAGPVIECKTPEGGTALVCEEVSSSEWAFAQVGAQDIKPVDKTVVGWRFAISTPDISEPPSFPANFASLCPDMSQPVSDQHRVAVAIDFGPAAIAPSGETPPTPNKITCVSLEVGQSAADALVLATRDVRGEGGFVCGIDGYPAQECGVEVDGADFVVAEVESGTTEVDADQTAEAEVVALDETGTSGESRWVWPLVGLAVVATLLVIFIAARRGRSPE